MIGTVSLDKILQNEELEELYFNLLENYIGSHDIDNSNYHVDNDSFPHEFGMCKSSSYIIGEIIVSIPKQYSSKNVLEYYVKTIQGKCFLQDIVRNHFIGGGFNLSVDNDTIDMIVKENEKSYCIELGYQAA